MRDGGRGQEVEEGGEMERREMRGGGRGREVEEGGEV